MTYKQIRDDTLRLLGRYSTAGAVIDESYNNQADYLDRIPSLVDDAQMLIATTVRPIPELYSLQLWLGKKQDGWLHFQLPEDFYRLSGRGLAVVRDGEFSRSHEFHLLGGTGLLVPEGLFGTVTLEYFRYPLPLGPEPEEDALPDNTPDTHALLPYYAAAHLAMADESYMYASLLHEFEARLERLRRPATAQRLAVADAYGGFGYEA